MDTLKNIPAFKFALILIAGIFTGSNFLFDFTSLTVLILILIIILILFRNKFYNEYIILALTFLLIFLTGIFKSNIDFYFIPENSIKHYPNTEQKKNNELVGVIKEIPYYDSSKIRFVLESQYIHTQQNSFEITGDVMVTIYENRWSKDKKDQPLFEVGDKVALLGKLSDAFGARNPGEFDYKRYLELHNVYKTFICFGYENTSVLSKDNLGYFYQKILFPSKLYAMSNIERNIPGDEGAYLKGLVSGERSSISQEVKDAFVKTGVRHLIAVSGLHVAIVIIVITLILSMFRIKPVPRTVITIIILIFYCFFTGSPASIIRATIMGSFVLIAIQMERKTSFYNIVGMAAIIILLFDSKQLFDPGFVLSFTAVISIVFFYTKFEKIFLVRIKNWNERGKKLLYLIVILSLTTLAAQIGTLPIAAMYFGKISIISLLANLIVVPFANIALAAGFFQIIAGIFSEFLSSAIAETNNLILSGQMLFIKWAASLKFAYIDFYKFDLFNTVFYFTILISIFTVKEKRQIFFRSVLIILILTGIWIYNFDFDRKLKITFIDVGQGDCALVQTPDGKNILVDCGIITDNYNSGERTIDPYLKRLDVDKIDLLILTHLHMDHIGGMHHIIENFKVGSIIESGQNVNNPFCYKMDSLILWNKIPRETVRAGDVIDAFENLRLYFIFPDNEFIDEDGRTKGDNLNNGSVVFILKYKDVSILFTGDIEREAEGRIYEVYKDFIDTDILKVSHHGSKTSSTIPFIVKNKPKHSVISCGTFNRYGHPSDIVLSRLEAASSDIYRTDLEGAVIFESDGKTIEKVEWK